jgi:hypothetical protein
MATLHKQHHFAREFGDVILLGIMLKLDRFRDFHFSPSIPNIHFDLSDKWPNI